MAATMVEHVVADAGAFLKKAPLQEIGKNIYTLKDVVEEIRDKPTRRSLSVLPYQLNFREPNPEYIRLVTEFSKKTGDYPSLSATDLKNIEDLSVSNSSGAADTVHTEPGTGTGSEEHKHSESHSEEHGSGSEEEEEDEEEEEEEDGGGWITPSNIKQNVLIQIGLHVLSVNGMLIKQARNYILRCHACFKTTTNMNKVFCTHCGNKTLKKIAVTVSEDGSMQMHFSKNPKVLNPKGKRYSLPLPQGGKHASNPHLVEDQRFPQQRVSRKARQKTDVFNPDYLAGGSSPFSDHDIYSRSANLHITDGAGGGGRRRANPNAARKKKC
ncbi:unnamed protein product [Coregonus sp. 'balchen']|nr:unnamed protein product [Coregonus sp. 'balchen']